MLPLGREPCEQLAWDTEFWGFRVGRVRADRLVCDDVPRIDAWCQAHGIVCLYFLATPHDFETTRLAEAAGFNLVDVRMTFSRSTSDVPDLTRDADHESRAADVSDIPTLRRIAAASYTDSRFYFDPRFPRERCDELYATWIETSVRGYADLVLVAARDGDPIGFVTVHVPEDGSIATIGLVGLDSLARGRGIAQDLIIRALRMLRDRGVSQCRVATQARNVAAQRAYARAGFAPEGSALWFHRWRR